MSPELISIIAVVVFITLLLLKMQVGIALLLVGFVGYTIVVGDIKIALAQLGTSPFGITTTYSLTVMPMFIFMGMILSNSDVSKELFRVANEWVGHFRAGLGIATVGASAIFSSISGSNVATTATMARVALPEMKNYDYHPALSTGFIAAGGSLGNLIPPSVTLILYGIITMEPIGPLLIAGFIPGVILAILFMLTGYLRVLFNPSLAKTSEQKVRLSTKLLSLLKVSPILIIFIISIGGIYYGIFTPTEAGGVGAFSALAYCIIKRKLSWKQFLESLNETVRLTAVIFIILIGAELFGQFLTITGLPVTIANLVASLEVSNYVILLGIFLLYIILGLFMESIPIMVLTLPIVYPLVIDLGFDGIWFGIVMTLLINIGFLTPPFGMSIFVIHGIAKDIPIPTIFRGALPMAITIFVFAVILVLIPEIVTFLPNAMK